MGFRTIRAHLTLLGLSGVLLALAFPRPGWWWLAYVALAPAALAAYASVSTRRLTWTAYVVGLAWWLVMARWVIPVTWPGYLGMSCVLGLYFVVALLLMRVLTRRCHLPATLALPLAWVSMEMVRGHFLAGGFGWFTLAQTQANYLPGQRTPLVIQCADLFGELTISFLVAMTSGWVVDLLTKPWFGRTPIGATRPGATVSFVTVLWLACLSAALVYGWRRASYEPGVPGAGEFPQVHIAVVQTNVPQDNREHPTPAGETREWQDLLALTQALADARLGQAPDFTKRVDLIVWPETVTPAPLDPQSIRYYQPEDIQRKSSAYYDQVIRDLVNRTGVSVLVGAHSVSWKTTTHADGQQYVGFDRLYNSAYLYSPQAGAVLPRYDKVHRVPFGEYIPWVEDWPWLKDHFIRYFTPYDFDYSLAPGKIFTVFSLPSPHRAVRFTTPICFEDAIPRVCQRMIYDSRGDKRADVLVNLTNDGWYAGWDQQYQHLQIATLRCVELRVPLARAVNTGISGFVDSTGRIVQVVQKDGRMRQIAGAASSTIQIDPRPTWFGWWGETPMWLLTAATGVLALVGMIVGSPSAKSRAPTAGKIAPEKRRPT